MYECYASAHHSCCCCSQYFFNSSFYFIFIRYLFFFIFSTMTTDNFSIFNALIPSKLHFIFDPFFFYLVAGVFSSRPNNPSLFITSKCCVFLCPTFLKMCISFLLKLARFYLSEISVMMSIHVAYVRILSVIRQNNHLNSLVLLFSKNGSSPVRLVGFFFPELHVEIL